VTGTNFAIASPVADTVTVCLFDQAGAETQIPVRDNDADVWHVFVPGVGPGRPTGTGSAAPGTQRAALKSIAARPGEVSEQHT
jgi:isoamylase